MNQEKRYWFVNKKYGFGWVPATWEGWLIIFLYIVGMLGWALTAFSKEETTDEVIRFFVGVFVLVALLLAICVKFGEPIEWKLWKKKDHHK